MSCSNLDDVRNQIEAAGLLVDGPLRIDTTKPVRCKVEGRDREKRGWYRLFSLGDLVCGAYGFWTASDPQTFKVS